MVEFLPAIMPDNLADWQQKALLVKGITPWAQVDIMDSVFVPSRSWPYFNGQQHDLASFTEEESGLPLWQDFNYEVDLMINKPEETIEEWIKAGFRRIIVHIESTSNMRRIIDVVKDMTGEKGSTWRVELGIALNTTTSIETIVPYIEHIEVVQCMGIERIGYQGQSFDERVVMQVSQLREKYPELIISVDGSVNQSTVKKLTEAGANRLVAGSALFGSENPKEALELLKKEIHV